ncbi:MAG: hypothetical protein Q9219_006511 [cf. Caloplaca sp. 3 TL-2023]
MQQPKIIPQLYKALDNQALPQTPGVTPALYTALQADVTKLHWLFARLEELATHEARSNLGLEILVQVVTTCQQIHDRRILPLVLTKSSRLSPGLKATIAIKVTKLSRYFSVSQFLLQAARKYPVFRRIRISAVCFRAQHLPRTEFDSMTVELIQGLSKGPKLRKLASKSGEETALAIENHIRQEATLTVPVHAEVQLLFHYETETCNLPPRIICSSKQACFLCDLFFKIHGKFLVPSTHGRLYEKWALPDMTKQLEDTNGEMLMVLATFVSAIENALLSEVKSTRKPYPAPYESIILHSAVCSRSNQSKTSTHSLPANHKSVSRQSLVFASKNAKVSRTASPLPHTEETTPAILSQRKVDGKCSRSEASSSATATATIHAPPPSMVCTEQVISSESSIDSNHSYVSLKKGRPIWRKISPNSPSFQARTPHIHLTISRDELLCNPLSHRASHDFDARYDHYWIILEYLSDNIDASYGNVPLVNLLDIPRGREKTLDYGSTEWPRILRVHSKGDTISIKYVSCQPIEGAENRSIRGSGS